MWTSLRVGYLLGIRQIQRASIWTTLLIIFIMTLTFLNLVGVSGILVGLIEGSVEANRNQYTGNVFISTPSGDPYIKDTITRICFDNSNKQPKFIIDSIKRGIKNVQDNLKS